MTSSNSIKTNRLTEVDRLKKSFRWWTETSEPYVVNFINIKDENISFDKITTSKINFNWTEIFDGSIPFKSVITRAEIIMSIWAISYRQAGPNHLWIDKHVVFGRPILIYDSLEKYLWNRPRTFLYALAKHLTKIMEGGDISALWRQVSHNAKMTRW